MKLYFKILAFIHEEKGLTTVEYAIAGGLVALAVVAAFITLGENVGATIDELANCASGNCTDATATTTP